MPHFILEYSSNTLDPAVDAAWLSRLHALLIESGPFKLEDIKSRVLRHETYCVGDGGRANAFVHLQLAILTGRSAEIRRAVSERLLEFLQESFPRSAKELCCSFSVEIREMEKDCYSKYTTGKYTTDRPS